MCKPEIKSKVLVLSSLVVAVAMLSGCDLFRRIAGRPTSSDIEGMRVEIIEAEQLAAREAFVADSLRKVEESRVDTLAVLDSIRGEVNMYGPSRLGGADKSVLNRQYYIVIGAFKDKSNADRLASKVTEAGYPATVIPFKNGMNVVGICPTDDVKTVHDCLKEVKRESFCPKEAWVLVNK